MYEPIKTLELIFKLILVEIQFLLTGKWKYYAQNYCILLLLCRGFVNINKPIVFLSVTGTIETVSRKTNGFSTGGMYICILFNIGTELPAEK